MADRFALRVSRVPPAGGGDEIREVWVSEATMNALSVCCAWPVDSVFFTVDDNTSPATLLGFGSWQLLGAQYSAFSAWKRTA